MGGGWSFFFTLSVFRSNKRNLRNGVGSTSLASSPPPSLSPPPPVFFGCRLAASLDSWFASSEISHSWYGCLWYEPRFIFCRRTGRLWRTRKRRETNLATALLVLGAYLLGGMTVRSRVNASQQLITISRILYSLYKDSLSECSFIVVWVCLIIGITFPSIVFFSFIFLFHPPHTNACLDCIIHEPNEPPFNVLPIPFDLHFNLFAVFFEGSTYLNFKIYRWTSLALGRWSF